MKESSARRVKTILLKLVSNDTGQMSVFIALIFQVLFVFFAMVINIGLIVHDKINLQNAVDFGAYYAAERQAEILNEIAHINYQIRQDYKLLAWRYRVLGTLGRDYGGAALPPARTPAGQPLLDVTWGLDAEKPSVCVANLMWKETAAPSTQEENHCFKGYNETITRISSLPIIAVFIPIVGIVAAQIEELKNAQLRSCEATGRLSWIATMQFLRAYKTAIAARKAVMQRLRTNLVADNFLDQNSQPVRDGVYQTVKNNLTVSNSASFDEKEFSVMNGLANDQCAGPNRDGSPTIKEINTAVTMLYTAAKSAGECTIGQRYATDFAELGVDPAVLASLRNLPFEPTNPGNLTSEEGLMASSLGFEKNPWCMAYVGVKARTTPRKPFAPFGEAVSLEARAFAQPFGGRIGPWYGSTWSKGAPTSNGTSRTDPLTGPRVIGGAAAANPDEYMPNFSRFPGDTLGLKSKAALGAERNLLRGYSTRGQNLTIGFYNDAQEIPQTGDPLAWDINDPDQTKESAIVRNVRTAEMIAVAPDIFDTTYYSIDPYFYQNYLTLSNSGTRFPGLPSIVGIPTKPISDIGSRSTVTADRATSVMDQITVANSTSGGGLDPDLRSAGSLNWFLYKWEHILTAWAPNSAQNFDFPNARFGQCSSLAPVTMMIPGGCVAGGRVGYSVRLISRDHLRAANWAVGGAGEGRGEILNPPGLDF